MTALRLVCASLVALAACGDDSTGDGPEDPQPQPRRIIEPPAGSVRAAPPHVIHSEGMGPYVLGVPQEQILELLPFGPKVVLMEVDGVVDYAIVRAEGGALMIGSERPSGETLFVAAVDAEVAGTEKGVGIGATDEEIARAMGPRDVRPGRVLDPRMRAFAGLPNARFVIENDRVYAVMVRRAEGTAEPGAEGDAAEGDEGDEPAPETAPVEPVATEPVVAPACRPGEGTAEERAAIVDAARLPRPAERVAQIAFGCFGAAGTVEALVFAGDYMVLVGGDPADRRRIVTDVVRGLVYAGPVDPEGDGRDEIVVVSKQQDDEALTMHVDLVRLDGGKLVKVAGRDVYRIEAASARWIGAQLSEIDLLIEVAARPDLLVVGGLYVQRGIIRAKTVAPLLPANVLVRRRRPGGGDDTSADAGPGTATGADAGPDAAPRRRGTSPRRTP